MVRRSLGVAIAILVAAAGGLRITSVAADPVVPVAAPASDPSASAPSASTPPASVSPPTPSDSTPPAAYPVVLAAEPGGGNARPSREGEGARVRREIERTERILGAVRKKVVRSYNRKARQDFEAAAQRQREAMGALEESFFARADRLTLEARSMARQVAFRLGPPQDDPDYVAMTLARTDDALKRAKEVVRDAGGEDELERLEGLDARQREARGLYKDGKIRRAYAATRQVRDGVLTLLRECDDLPVPPATAERALKRAVRALENSESELGERLTETARRLEREARAQLAKARVAFSRKNYRDTLLHAKLVERKLESAVAAQRDATNRSG